MQQQEKNGRDKASNLRLRIQGEWSKVVGLGTYRENIQEGTLRPVSLLARVHYTEVFSFLANSVTSWASILAFRFTKVREFLRGI